MSRMFFLPVLVLLMFLATGCGRPANPYAANVKNVIIIAIDTLRANHLGYMGYERDTSPFMDEFAAKSIVYENAFTPKSLTLPSFTSFFSGLHPIKTKIYKNMWPLSEDIHMLTEDFKSAGFKTVFLSASGILHSRYRMNKGFDVYIEADPHPEEAWHMIEKAKAEVEQSDGPLFLTVHFWETHSPYDPDPEVLAQFADPDYEGPMDGSVDLLNAYILGQVELNEADIQNAIDRYDGDIRWLDNQLRELFTYFDEKGLIDNSIIIIMSDHGERLGEGHIFQHRRDSDLELHIPVIIHFPGDLGAGTRITSLVEITDILPTIMDILGISIPKGIDGMTTEHLFKFNSMLHRQELTSIGVDDGGYFLYSKYDGIERTRVKLDIKDPEPVFLDEQSKERLKSLGYIH